MVQKLDAETKALSFLQTSEFALALSFCWGVGCRLPARMKQSRTNIGFRFLLGPGHLKIRGHLKGGHLKIGCRSESGRKKAHKHKLFAQVNVQMALGQTAGCPRVSGAKKFMCSPRNTGKKNFSLWSTGGLSQGCPDFQKVYVL